MLKMIKTKDRSGLTGAAGLTEALSAPTLKDNRAHLIELAARLSLPLAPVESGLLHPKYIAFDMMVRRLVNPMHQSLTLVHGAAGASMARPLLATDATRMICLDQNPVCPTTLLNTLKKNNWNRADKESVHYLEHKFTYGYCPAYNSARSAARNVLTEIAALGIEPQFQNGQSSIHVSGNKALSSITFEWTYPGQSRPKLRKVHFVQADLTEPETYQAILKKLTCGKIQAYYQCATFDLLRVADQYLPAMTSLMSAGGHIIADTRENMGLGGSISLKSALKGTKRDWTDCFELPEGKNVKLAHNRYLKFYGQAYKVFRLE
jgi:hypothetical protein